MMSPQEYREKLRQLGLTPETAPEMLGISRSTAYRYASGETVVSATVARLINTMLERKKILSHLTMRQV